MEQKHYKKCLKMLISAGISKKRIADECKISRPTIDSILKWDIPSDTTKDSIITWYDKIVASFISLEK